MTEILDCLNLISVSSVSDHGIDLSALDVDKSSPDNFVVRARQNLKNRQVIAIDHPVTIVTPRNALGIEALAKKFDSTFNQMLVKLWASKIMLDCGETLQFLADLHPRTDNTEISTVYCKLFANMFQTLGGGYHIFSTFTFINHSCNANSIIIVGEHGTYKLIALRDIAAGEEITQDYVGLSLTNRKAEILSSYGFECNCGFCDDPQISCKFLLHHQACWTCRKPNPKSRCSQCKVSLYCEASCQRKDWPKHKNICGTLGKIFTYDPQDPQILPGVNIEQLQSQYC